MKNVFKTYEAKLFCSRIRHFRVLVALTFSFFLLTIFFSEGIQRKSCFPHVERRQHGRSLDNGRCMPLKPIPFLVETDDVEVAGKYMEETSETRKKANFILQPRNTMESAHNCKHQPAKNWWTLVFFAKSSIRNRDRRDAIRATWGAVKVLDGTRIEVIFVVGSTEDNELQHEVVEESEVYGDILQMDMIDSHKTVPEKVLAGMQWASEFLPEHWLYASVDDDIAVHLGNLVSYFNTLMQPREPLASLQRPCYENLPLVCVYSYQDYDAPDRNVASKWYISYDKVPDEIWPKYCRGGLYVMPVKMTAELYEASRRTAYLYLDDVWITGFMRRKLGYGDCNIMPAPYSQIIDYGIPWLLSSLWKKHVLMTHLWGNTEYYTVDVSQLMHEDMESWKDELKTHDICAVKLKIVK